MADLGFWDPGWSFLFYQVVKISPEQVVKLLWINRVNKKGGKYCLAANYCLNLRKGNVAGQMSDI